MVHNSRKRYIFMDYHTSIIPYKQGDFFQYIFIYRCAFGFFVTTCDKERELETWLEPGRASARKLCWWLVVAPRLKKLRQKTEKQAQYCCGDCAWKMPARSYQRKEQQQPATNSQETTRITGFGCHLIAAHKYLQYHLMTFCHIKRKKKNKTKTFLVSCILFG